MSTQLPFAPALKLVSRAVSSGPSLQLSPSCLLAGRCVSAHTDSLHCIHRAMSSDFRLVAGAQLQQPAYSCGDGQCQQMHMETASLSVLSGCWTAQILLAWVVDYIDSFFFFTADYIIVLKVHWLTLRLCFLISWYSSNISCSKIFSLTKFNEYNSRANRHNISCGKEETQHKLSHGQSIFTSWRGHRHKNLAFTNLVFRLMFIFKALWQGDSIRKYKST